MTGSLIPQETLTSMSPVSVIDSDELTLEGITNVEDLINSLPQAYGDMGSTLATDEATGIATLNLRGLGPARTLVLINGRRVMPGDPITPFADLNVIPASLVRRIEVLTGGASSVYGSDAEAGVVNFLLKDKFSGINLDMQYGAFMHSNDNRSYQQYPAQAGFTVPRGNVTDGQRFDGTVSFGTSTPDQNGHVVGYAGYRRMSGILMTRRDSSACTLVESPENIGTTAACSGSSASANGTFYTGNANDPNGNEYQLGSNATLVPGTTLYNSNAASNYQRPDARYIAGLFAHYDLSPALNPYLETMLMEDNTTAQVDPSGIFGSTSNINCDNPMLSGQERSIVCAPGNLVGVAADGVHAVTGTATAFINVDGTPYHRGVLQIQRRNVEGGGRLSSFRHGSYRFVLGSKGAFGQGFSYDAYGQFGTTIYARRNTKYFSDSHIANSLDVVDVNGTPTCRSVVDGTDPRCVPYNIFGTGAVTPAALAYLQVPPRMDGVTREAVFSTSISGLLGKYGLKLPWASRGIAFNAGSEYRRESVDLRVDQYFLSGDLSGLGSGFTPVNGSYSAAELFGETRVPLVNHRAGIEDLSAEFGYRYSRYSTAAATQTWKAQAAWTPFRGLRFRAGFDTAVRTPNLQELFNLPQVGGDGVTDPCSGTHPAFTSGQCALQGVTPAQYGHIDPNPSGEYNGLEGGNRALLPEIAHTLTAGAVIAPPGIAGLSLTADFFDIKIDRRISSLVADNIVHQCGLSGNPFYCSLIHRDSNGSLWKTEGGYVTDLLTNSGSVETRGIDLGLDQVYKLKGAGKLKIDIKGTLLNRFTYSAVESTPYDCAGYFGSVCGSPIPQWRHKARVTWQSNGGLTTSLQWRYFGAVKVDRSSSNPNMTGIVFPVDRRIAAQSYFDLAFSVKIGDFVQLRLGADNLLDKDPPVITTQDAPIDNLAAGNTFPSVYSPLGRYVFAGATVTF
ncbi:MAG: TonB-dependent receptor [Pseudomonadota bacterium]|nr:TonB-dependent receptor [Pseudomonadota bacterium]